MFLNIKFYIPFCICICLLIGSCTKDYFVTESNVKLYVPQLVNGDIKNLTMIFHGSKGEFLMRKKITYSDLQQYKDNIIKISIPVNSISGSVVIITCISDLDDKNNDLISDNTDFFSSKITSYRTEDNNNRFHPTSDYRFYRYRKIVKPLGVDPKTDTLDVDKDHLHKGNISLAFKSLPTEIKSARIRYYGLGSFLDFYGKYNSEESHYKKIIATFSTDPMSKTVSAYFLPSQGQYCAQNIHHGDIRPPLESTDSEATTTYKYLDIHVEFLGANGEILGNYRLSEDINPPTITGSDNTTQLPANKLNLVSQGKLNFEFDGFTLTKFELIGWNDDIIDGDTTPM